MKINNVEIGTIRVAEIIDNQDDTCTIVFDVPDNFKRDFSKALKWNRWSDKKFNDLVGKAIHTMVGRLDKDYDMPSKKVVKKVAKRPTKKSTTKEIASKLLAEIDEIEAKIAVSIDIIKAECDRTWTDQSESVIDLVDSVRNILCVIDEDAERMYKAETKLNKLARKG